MATSQTRLKSLDQRSRARHLWKKGDLKMTKRTRINSKQKGATGERELASVLSAHGWFARRAQQYCGYHGTEDLVHSIPGVHIECKRVERLNLVEAYKQAKRDAILDKLAIVCHRSNRSPWLVTLSLDDFLRVIGLDDALD
jgi:hypothetical protein